MRFATACSQCRSRRSKCTRASDGGPCSGCMVLGTNCSFSKRSTEKPPLLAAAYAGESPPLPCEGPEVQAIVEDYIRFIHDRPHSLFHEPSLRKAVRDNTISRALLFAICALACRFSTDAAIRGLWQRYFTEAKVQFHAKLEEVNVSSLQTCILLANIFGTESQPASETFYFSIAIRMIDILRLNHRKDSQTPLEWEVNKRIYLSVYVADRWHSAGSGFPMLLDDHHLPEEPAIDEHIFHSAAFGHQIHRQSHDIGLWALRMQLTRIYSDIQSLVMDVAGDKVSPQTAELTTEKLALALDRWQAALPSRFVLNSVNLERHKQCHTGGSFVDLFLGFHHYANILFFQFLGQQRPDTAHRHPYAERCRQHALEYSSLLSLARGHSGCEAIHNTVGQMTVVSSSTLLYFLLSGETGNEATIRSALLSNFATIGELDGYWPAANRWVDRLFVFQSKCAQWPLPENFAMSRWMVRFLLEYALPLEPTDGDAENPVRKTLPARLGVPSAPSQRTFLSTTQTLERLL